MKNSTRKIVAFMMAVVLATSIFAGGDVQAAGITINNADGTTTVQNTVTDTLTDSMSGNVTQTVTVTKDTTGTVYSSTLGTNAALVKNEVEVDTTVKDAAGNLLSETEYVSEVGSEKAPATTQVPATMPNVTVTLKDKATVTAVGIAKGGTTISGDKKANDQDKIYDYTVTTLTDAKRTVSGTMSALKWWDAGNKLGNFADLNMVYYSKLVGYDVGGGDVVYGPDQPDSGNINAFKKIYSDSSKPPTVYNSYYYPIIHYRTEEEYELLPQTMKNLYTKTAWANIGNYANAGELTRIRDYYNARKSTYGEALPSYLYNLSKRNTWYRAVDDGVWWDWAVVATPHYNDTSANDNGIILKNKTKYDIEMYLCYDRFGKEAITYCLDEPIRAGEDSQNFYTIENLYEASYFKGTEDEVADIKAHIRAVALNGYWGRSSSSDYINFGSRMMLINNLKDAINDSASGLVGQAYGPKDKVYNKSDLIALANGINNSEAMLATQAALWRYGRNGYDFRGFTGDDDTTIATMELIYAWLTSDYLVEQCGTPTVLIDEDSFFDTENVKITVKNKKAGSNTDYNIDLSFTMYHTVTSNDDLTVYLYQNGSELKRAKLGTNQIKRDGNTYTFENLSLAKNTNVTYKLVIKGTQEIEEREAFIFRHTEGYDVGQTLIAVGFGTNEVDAATSFNFSYDVIEGTQSVTREHLWARESSTTTEYAVVSGSKVWSDFDNAYNTRPDSITINLLADGVLKDSRQVTAADNWKWTFANLPKYDASGKLISYTITENAVADYQTTISGYNVTNTVELISVLVEKEWDDSDNQDGKRSASVEIELLENGQPTGKKVTLNAANNWKSSFDGLAVGRTYTVREVNVPAGYDDSISGSMSAGYIVTNSYTPEKTVVAGEKIWDDNNDEYGNRPDSITINLLANGTEIAEKTVTEADNWKWTFANLDKYQNGTEIAYTVTEDPVVCYESIVNGYDITNKYVQEWIAVSGSKTWDDNDDQDGKRPDSIVVRLLADGVQVDEKTVTEADEWKWDFGDRIKYRNGREIVYTITEDPVADYETDIERFDVTNHHEPEKISVSGEKTWNDADDKDKNRPESITIRLLVDGTEADAQTVTAADGWKWSFTELAKYAAGKEIKYTITEDTDAFYRTQVNGFNVTNTYTPELITVAGVKHWEDADDQDGIRPASIIVNLLADGVEVAEKEVTAADDWEYSFTQLPKYQNRKEVVYTVTEDPVANYESEVEGHDIINTHTPETIAIGGEKIWNDENNQDGIRPDSVTIHLLADGVKVAEKEVKASEGWKYQFADLAKYAAGREIVYTITENEVPGYDSEVNGFNVINTHTPDTVVVSGTKTWYDGNNISGNRPASITVHLFDETEEIDSIAVTANENWSYCFENLPKHRNGEEIAYHITEDAVAGYITSYDGYDIINTATTAISGSKVWVDRDNLYGNRPDSITVNLLADGVEVDEKVVSAADNWTYSFSGVARYTQDREIVYTVTEEAVGGYTTQINGYTITNTEEMVNVLGNKIWDDANDQDGKRPETITIRLLANGTEMDQKTVSAIDGWSWNFTELPRFIEGQEVIYTITEDEVAGYVSIVSGYQVTNSYTPETTSVSGTKIWVDNDNAERMRPANVVVNLMADGQKVDSRQVSEDTNWTWNFDNLPKFRAGQEIVYTVHEDAVAYYSGVVSGNDIVNTYTPELITVSGYKNWNDGNDQDGIRPDSITIQLLAGGEVAESRTVSAGDSWSWNFTELPKHKEGQEITYSIVEVPVEGYETVVEGYNVTNTHTPETVSVSGIKYWDDHEDQDGLRPESITVSLLAQVPGEAIRTVDTKVVTAADGWKWNFEGVAKYQNGVEITYSIAESAVEGYTCEITGYNITNCHTPAKINVAVQKIWVDNNNGYGVRPASVKVHLLADGVEIASKDLTEADGWSWSINDLAKYAAGKEVVYTITEDPVANYQGKVDGFTVTNTYVQPPQEPGNPPQIPPVDEPGDESADESRGESGEDESRDNGYVDIFEEDIPLGAAPLNDMQLVTLFDEAVPLGAVPRTGDDSGKWIALALAAVSGLVGIIFCSKRRKENY